MQVVFEPNSEFARDVDARFVAGSHIRLQHRVQGQAPHVVVDQVRPLMHIHAQAMTDAMREVLEAWAVAAVNDDFAGGSVDRSRYYPGLRGFQMCLVRVVDYILDLHHLVGRLAEYKRSSDI